jgi:hypothetical protein
VGGILLTAPLDVALAEHTVVQPDLLYLSAERLRESREGAEGPPALTALRRAHAPYLKQLGLASGPEGASARRRENRVY